MLDLHMKCDNCKSENMKILYRLSYMDINECKECGLRFTDQSKIPKSLYTENYFKKTNKHFFEDSWADYETKIKTSKKLRRFKDTLKKLEKYTNKGNLLDVGCATGVFLDIAKKTPVPYTTSRRFPLLVYFSSFLRNTPIKEISLM